MKPIDFRNAMWEEIAAEVVGKRLAVWEGWRAHGPCTTRELARRMGWDVCNVRPRTTELYQLGLIALESVAGKEGRYRALTWAEARLEFARRKGEATGVGVQLPLL